MQINYEAIMDTCANMGVNHLVSEIDLMLAGKIKISAKVREAIEKTAKGVQVKFSVNPVRAEPLTTDEQLDQVYALIESGIFEKKQLLEMSGLEEYVLTQVLQRLRKIDKIHCAGTKAHYRWIVGAKPVNRGLMIAARAYALENKLKTYEGAPHAKCGTVTKYAASGNCQHCHQKTNKDRYIKPIKELLK